MSPHITFSGIDMVDLRQHLAAGVDPGGNPIESFVDRDGSWSLRCCLGDSGPDDEIAIISWSPFPWDGPYREAGPIVVHTSACHGAEPTGRLPAAIDARPMQLRPYGHDRRIAYHRMRYVDANESVTDAAATLLAHDDVDFVHGRNIIGGCYAFTATRLGA